MKRVARRLRRIPSDLITGVSVATLLLVIPGSARAQDPCPSASAVTAEQGWTAYSAGDMTGARARFEAALAQCANDQYARTGLGYVALREGDTAEATSLMQIVIEAEPNNVDALVALGLASWRAGAVDEVERYFNRVIQLTPDHPTALEYLDRIAGGSNTAAGPINEADAAWNAGDSQRALRLYTERLALDPNDDVALLRVGLVRAWSGQYAAAMELLGILVARQPSNLDAVLARARVRAWSGDIAGAQRDVQQILAVQPDNADALAALALFQSWSGQFDEAFANYDQLLSIAPDHAAGQREYAQAMAWAEDYEQSLAAFEGLVAANPGDVDALLGLATALGYSGAFDEAIDVYDEILNRNPDDVRALTGKAKALGSTGKLIEGERTALLAVEREPDNAQAWSGLGLLYRMQGRNAATLTAVQRAAELAPTDPGIRDQLRGVERSLAPLTRPTIAWERDSDDNEMLTTSLAVGLHPIPRLEIRATAYRRGLVQALPLGDLDRTATGLSVLGTYELGPGWMLSGGVGGSETNGFGDPSFVSFSLGARTPLRMPVGFALNVSSAGLDENAALAERGIRATEVVLTSRWNPNPLWRVDANLGLGRYSGSEDNGRRSGYLSATKRLNRHFSLGGSFRGFSFEKNLNDGYFDPDFYGVAEITTAWSTRPLPWALLLEFAPGMQQIRSDGDRSASVRTKARVGYTVGPSREVSLSFGYSSAGLTSFASGDEGYSYTAVVLGFNWVF